MILACKEYLLSILKQMDIRGRIYTSLKELEVSNAIEYGAVLFDGEIPTRSTQNRRMKSPTRNIRRFKTFDRKMKFLVSFGSASVAHTQALYEDFMNKLPKGFLDTEENYIPIVVEEVDWMEKNDSILRSELLVQIRILFEGGLYHDHEILKIQEIEQDHEIRKEI